MNLKQLHINLEIKEGKIANYVLSEFYFILLAIYFRQVQVERRFNVNSKQL